MARRRYISTAISTDPALPKLAKKHGEFAAMLYTWMIPHAEDNGCITADIDSLILMVIPGFRWITEEQVEGALLGMVELNLIQWNRERNEIRFPDSFYKYQKYISKNRRKSRTVEDDAQDGEHAPESAQRAKSIAENIIAPESAQNPASFKVSVSAKSSRSTTLQKQGEDEVVDEVGNLPPPDRVPWKKTDPVPEKATLEWLVDAWNEILPEYGLPRVREVTKQRRERFKQQLSENPERKSTDYWLEVFEKITESDFMCGRTPPREGQKIFICSLPWLLERKEALAKVVEGFYANNNSRASPEFVDYTGPPDAPADFADYPNFDDAVPFV